MHNRVPRFKDAQSGSGEPQSQQTALPGTRLRMSIGLFGEAALANSLPGLWGDKSPAGTYIVASVLSDSATLFFFRMRGGEEGGGKGM